VRHFKDSYNDVLYLTNYDMIPSREGTIILDHPMVCKKDLSLQEYSD
jgi:hypothetical protein